MTFDLRKIQRRLKPEKRTAQLQRRADEALPFADPRLVPVGARVMYDTCVYLDVAADRIPDEVAPLLRRRIVFHSSVCINELAFGLGTLDPDHPDTPASRRVLEDIIQRIGNDERTMAPDDHTWVLAGMLAGILTRTQRYGPAQRRKAIADCLLFATALREGLTLLTANLAEFDPLHQLFPEARIAFYRAA